MTKLNGVKNAIMHMTYFLIGLVFKMLMFCHIVLYWEKATSYVKCSHSLTLQVHNVWKISAFSCYRKNFQKLQLKWKIVYYILFSMPSKLIFVNRVSFFEQKCFVKCVIFFVRFCYIMTAIIIVMMMIIIMMLK